MTPSTFRAATIVRCRRLATIGNCLNNAGKKMATPSDKQVVAAYSAITGYNPSTGANDNGAVEIDVLNYWRQTGIAGHKIGAYVALGLDPEALAMGLG